MERDVLRERVGAIVHEVDEAEELRGKRGVFFVRFRIVEALGARDVAVVAEEEAEVRLGVREDQTEQRATRTMQHRLRREQRLGLGAEPFEATFVRLDDLQIPHGHALVVREVRVPDDRVELGGEARADLEVVEPDQ